MFDLQVADSPVAAENTLQITHASFSRETTDVDPVSIWHFIF
jgi:hypothetical protein